MGAAVTATLGAAEIVLFGRQTYDSFAGAWPERDAAARAYKRAGRHDRAERLRAEAGVLSALLA
jgi:dihydrofolate reductase